MIPSPHKSNLPNVGKLLHPAPRNNTQRMGNRKAVSVFIHGFKVVVFIFFCTGLFVLFGALLKGGQP